MKPIVTLVSALACALTSACDTSGEHATRHRRTAALALDVQMSGADSACFRFTLAEMAPRTTCAEVKGDRASLREEMLCDGPVRAVVALADVSPSDPWTTWTGPFPRSEGTWLDPCGAAGCELELACGEPATRLELVLADVGAYPTRTTVTVPGVMFGAAAATCLDGSPITLSVDPDEPERTFAVLQLWALTEGGGLISVGTPTITCAGGFTCALDPDIAGTFRTATCSDGTAVDYEVVVGLEWTSEWSGALAQLYVNLAVALDDLVDAGVTDCRLEHAATATLSPLDVGPRAAYPLLRYALPLIDADGVITCQPEALGDERTPDPDLLGVGYLLGEALGAPGEPASPRMCHTWDGSTLRTVCP